MFEAKANVQVGQVFFNPTSTSINVGDTVTWTWVGGTHNVISETGIWSSSTQSSGTFSRQFNSPGNFPYYCSVHSFPGGSAQNAVINVTAPNNPPSISIPANNAVFVIAPTNIVVNASASDTDGTISQVQFILDSVAVGTDTTNPYSFTNSNVGAGNHSLTVVATDNHGAKSTNSISV